MANLQGLVLSAAEIRANNPAWSDAMIEDYLTIIENSVAINDEIGSEAEKIAANTLAITVNAVNITTNSNNIGTNTTNIGINTTSIGTNTTNITTNTTNIGTNTTAIGTNTTNIGTNTTNIALKANKVVSGTTNAILVQSAGGDLVDSGDLISNLLCLDFAGNPNTNVTSNKSRLCVDTTGSQMYFNPTVGVNTGWVAV